MGTSQDNQSVFIALFVIMVAAAGGWWLYRWVVRAVSHDPELLPTPSIASTP